jgi:serine/threonine-protein kinase HipA
MTIQQLAVWSSGNLVGRLSIVHGRWAFSYEAEWIAQGAFALSPQLPIQALPFEDHAANKQVEWFFDNLLPEGVIRDALAKGASLDRRNTWGLLERFGQEMAGALTVLAHDSPYPTDSYLRPVSQAALREMIDRARTGKTPLLAAFGTQHMSLAGVQEKLAIHMKEDSSMWLPEGVAASTHILKPDNFNGDFPFCPANEWLCMNLASALGLPAPKVNLLRLPEPVYVIERFDRRVTNNDVSRIHHIDLCQVCGVWSGKKYEDHGGLGIADLIATLDHSSRPALDLDRALSWIVFNYLIGNNDAHAKNLSFLMGKEKTAIAPFYDLVCVEAYLPGEQLSMSIGGHNKPGWVEGPHWDALALEAGVRPLVVRKHLQHQIEGIEKHLPMLLQSAKLTDTEKRFLSDKLAPALQSRIDFARTAMATPPCDVKSIEEKRGLVPDDVLERIAKRAEAGGRALTWRKRDRGKSGHG